MINNGNDQIPILQFLWLILISFIASFSKTLNEYATTNTKHTYTFILFISQVLLSGVCGVLIGTLTKSFSSNIYLVTFSCGLGGLLGLNSLKLGVKIFFSLKHITISDSFVNDAFDDNKNIKSKNKEENKNNKDKVKKENKSENEDKENNTDKEDNTEKKEEKD